MKKIVFLIAVAGLIVSCGKDKAASPAPDRCLSMQPYEESTESNQYIDGAGDVYTLEGSTYTNVSNDEYKLDCAHVEHPPEVLTQPEPPVTPPVTEPYPPTTTPTPPTPTTTYPPEHPEPTACIDHDGDGWGWDGYQSCRMDGPIPVGPCVDSDGDGWGWNGQSSCRTGEPYPVGECIDTDGDGWGWNGRESCRVHVTTTPCHKDSYGKCTY